MNSNSTYYCLISVPSFRFVRWEKAIKVSRQACEEAITTGLLQIEGKDVSVEEGITTHVNYISQGKLYANGRCEYPEKASFVTDGTTYSYSIEQSFLAVRVDRLTGRRDRARGIITWDNGLIGDFKTGWTFDSNEGLVIWDPLDRGACTRDLSGFYSGKGRVWKRSDRDGLQGAVVIAGTEDQQESNSARNIGIMLGSPVNICGRTCYQTTSLEGFVACFKEGTALPFPHIQFDPAMMEDTASSLQLLNIKAHSDFLYVRSQLAAHKRFAQIVRTTCELERKVLFGRLAQLAGGQNQYSLLDLFGKGHLLTQAGPEVTYVTKCIPLEVEPAAFPNCTSQTPVRRIALNGTKDLESSIQEDRIYFRDALTHVLQKFPEILVCTANTPVRWRINSIWHCSKAGSMEQCPAPVQLQPSLDSAGDLTKAFGSGLQAEALLTTAMRNSMHAFQLEASHREAVITEAVHNGILNAHDLHLGSTVSPNDITEWSTNVIAKLSPWWLMNAVGTGLTVFLGILTVISLLWNCTTSIARLVTEFSQFGWRGGRTVGRACLSCMGIVSLPRYLVEAVLQQMTKQQQEDMAEEDLRERRSDQEEDQFLPRPATIHQPRAMSEPSNRPRTLGLNPQGAAGQKVLEMAMPFPGADAPPRYEPPAEPTARQMAAARAAALVNQEVQRSKAAARAPEED